MSMPTTVLNGRFLNFDTCREWLPFVRGNDGSGSAALSDEGLLPGSETPTAGLRR